MIRYQERVFDEFVPSGQFVYTSMRFAEVLGGGHQIGVQALVRRKSGVNGIRVSIEHSGDGRVWSQKNPTTPLITASTAGPGVTKVWGGERLTDPRSLELVRLRIQLIATGTPSAYVTLFAVVRDFARPDGCGCKAPRRSSFEVPTALPSAVSIGDDPVRDLMDAHAAIPYAALEEVQRISAVLDESSGPARIAAIRARLPADSLAELDAFMERVSVLPAEVRERALPGWGRPTAQGDDDLAEYGRLGERLGDGADALSDATGVLPWP